MTKTEQTRLMTWRFRVLHEAGATSRNVARLPALWNLPPGVLQVEAAIRATWCGGIVRPPSSAAPITPCDTERGGQQAAVPAPDLPLRPPQDCGLLEAVPGVSVAASSVHRILGKHGMSRLPANQKYRPHTTRWKRYEKPQPGHRLQMDVKFLERIPGTHRRLYQFTAIDDCTRIRVLKVYDACNQRTAIQFADEVLRRLPFRVLVVQTDNGAEFQSRFHWHLEGLDIRHVYIRPRTPRLNGKVERSHRVDDQEFYQLLDQDGIRDDIHLFNQKLREWEDYYNYHRPHGALSGQTPYERLLAKTERKCHPGPETLHIRKMAGSTGLEPATSGVTGQRSNQLNYDPARVTSNCELQRRLQTANFKLDAVAAVQSERSVRSSKLEVRSSMVGGTGLEPVTAGV